eukprot:1160987-Pelagomonas_calceolata.AAC.1
MSQYKDLLWKAYWRGSIQALVWLGASDEPAYKASKIETQRTLCVSTKISNINICTGKRLLKASRNSLWKKLMLSSLKSRAKNKSTYLRISVQMWQKSPENPVNAAAAAAAAEKKAQA